MQALYGLTYKTSGSQIIINGARIWLSKVIIMWRKIDNYDYEINELGEVRRIGTTILKSPTFCKNRGYLVVQLWKNNVGRVHFIHRLVAIAFVEGDHSLSVNHIDGNKLNNAPENLEFITLAENTRHQHRTGLMNPVAQYKCTKVPPEDYERIVERFDEGEPMDFIAGDYGCSQPLISWILRKAKPQLV